MRASRLLSILLSLQARGLVTAQELAEQCEVSVRTIYRDIDALSAAGVPVYSERGSEGGYRLLDGYKTRLNGLSQLEAESLFLAGLTGPAADLGLGAVMATAQTKLVAALPQAMRPSVERMRSRFHFDAPAWFAGAEAAPYLRAVAEAVWEQTPLQVRYRSWKAERERRIEPLGIVLKGGAWYLVAQEQGNSPRTFRVSRILELERLGGSFEPPDDFDLQAHWRASAESLEAQMYERQATARLSPRGAELLAVFSPPFVRTRIRLSDDCDASGWRTATFPVRGDAADLLALGDEIEVLEPPELRARMGVVAQALSRLYGT